MSKKETLFVNKTSAVLPHPTPKMIPVESQRDHQEEQEERVLLAEEMATGDNPVHSQEIIPDNEAETYEGKNFHSSHISSLNEPSGNCIKDSEFESGEKVCIVKGSLKNHLQFWHKIGTNVCHRRTRKWLQNTANNFAKGSKIPKQSFCPEQCKLCHTSSRRASKHR